MPDGDNNMQNSPELPSIGIRCRASARSATHLPRQSKRRRGRQPNRLPVPTSESRTPSGSGFCRGYPRLVLWFPEHPRPATKARGLAVWRRTDDERPPVRANEAEAAATRHPMLPATTPPSPWDSPPFPGSEYQGYPLIGTPSSPNEDPTQLALLLGPHGDSVQG